MFHATPEEWHSAPQALSQSTPKLTRHDLLSPTSSLALCEAFHEPGTCLEAEMKIQSGPVVAKALGKSIRPPGKPAKAHPGRKILPFHVAGAHFLWIGFSENGNFVEGDAGIQRSARLLARCLELLHKHCVVGPASEDTQDRVDVGNESISCDLRIRHNTSTQIVDEIARCLFIALSDEIANHCPRGYVQSDVGVDSPMVVVSVAERMMKDFVLADRFLQSCIDLPEDLRRMIVSRLRALARDPRDRNVGIARVEIPRHSYTSGRCG